VATSEIFVDRRGERNVPKRYLKDAEWYSDKYLGEGYYVADPDNDDRFCAVCYVSMARSARRELDRVCG
jgi:hypothetical protein